MPEDTAACRLHPLDTLPSPPAVTDDRNDVDVADAAGAGAGALAAAAGGGLVKSSVRLFVVGAAAAGGCGTGAGRGDSGGVAGGAAGARRKRAWPVRSSRLMTRRKRDTA